MKLLTVVAAVGLCAGVLTARQAAPQEDTMAALLSEVRQLRLVIERSAATSPKIQILASRLTVQDQRIARMTRDLTEIRDQITRKAAEAQSMTARAAELETMLPHEPDSTKKRSVDNEMRVMKEQADALSAEEQQLRVREAEAAGALAVEQTQWTELSRRLDELEKSLDVIR